MKGLIWSSSRQKKGNSASDDQQHRKQRYSGSHSSRSLNPLAHSSSPNNTTTHKVSQSTSSSNLSQYLNTSSTAVTDKWRSSVRKAHGTSRSNSIYISDRQSKSAQSIVSKNKSNDNLIVSNRRSATDLLSTTQDSTFASISLNNKSTSSLSSTGTAAIEDPNATAVTLSNDNYDNTVFKVGWINKSEGQITIVNRHHGSDQSSGSSTITNSQDHSNVILAPDYKLFRAKLRGPILYIYKSGLPSSIKCFDPSLTMPSSSTATLSSSASENEARNADTTEPTKQGRPSALHLVPEVSHIDYLSEKYPHPALKLDPEGNVWLATVESLCHTILFSPQDSEKDLVNLLLICPLIENLATFLATFNLFGILFQKHQSTSSIGSQCKHYIVSSQVERQMTQRLELVCRVILEFFQGVLLDEKNFKLIISLVDTISLHDDSVSDGLKKMIADKHNLLNKLTRFTKLNTDKALLDSLLSPQHFLQIDTKLFTESIHQIDMVFNKYWDPSKDYSLLYDSKHISDDILILNPLAFNVTKNVHFLGRLLINHLLQPTETKLDFFKMSQVLSKWIQIGCKFEEIGDMVSWLAIATIICSIPILRLSSIWKYISDQEIKMVFKDWVPTLAQLDRRQMSSKSTGSVFILAPPNLENKAVRSNVVPYFGDLIIYADALPKDSKFKYLAKKINRTKHAFYKWEQRIQAANSSLSLPILDYNNCGELLSCILQVWKYHISQPPINIESIMKLSLETQPPAIDQKQYSTIGTHRSPLLVGNYLPILFNDMLPSYSLFSKESLIGASGVVVTNNKAPPSRSVNRKSKSFQISSPIPASTPIGPTFTEYMLDDSQEEFQHVTGLQNIDMPIIKEMSSKLSNKQHLLKSIRDVFNIDMDTFSVSDDLIFKSLPDFDRNAHSRPSSVVIETPKRFSQLSVSNMTPVTNSNIAGNPRNSQFTVSRLSKSLENMDIFGSIGKLSDNLNEMELDVVLKAGSLDRIYDLLVLTTGIFSKLLQTRDLEKYFAHYQEHNDTSNAQIPSGLLDYAFVKLTMDNDLFTETFFNTYKSFTTTLATLESLAKRYIKAKACSISISKFLESSTSIEDMTSSKEYASFPNWDLKVTKEEEEKVNLLYMAMIQVGVIESLLHFVKFHYVDFTDNLACNNALLDIVKIIEEEITSKWPERLEKEVTDAEKKKEINVLYGKMSDLFQSLKLSYQKQLYRPIGIDKLAKSVLSLYMQAHEMTIADLDNMINGMRCNDPMIQKFQALKYNDYKGIIYWVYELDDFISKKMSLVSKQEWFIVYQQFELFSISSLTSLFQTASVDITQLERDNVAVDKMAILNFFSWISQLSTNDSKKKFLTTLPDSFQMLVRLHTSLTHFFSTAATSSHISFERRVEVCTLIIQILNYVRWKNSSLNLFHVDYEEDGEKSHDTCNDAETIISPHVPSFVETAICDAILTPEARYYEVAWRGAYDNLSTASYNKLTSIYDILQRANPKHIKSFVENETLAMAGFRNLCPCPGWFVRRLLEISQFVPNMSITNSKLINFDKRRFVNNIIANVLNLIPQSIQTVNQPAVGFGLSLLNSYYDKKNEHLLSTKAISSSESAAMGFISTGLYQKLLDDETIKLKREQQKLMALVAQERDSKRAAVLRQVIQDRNRNSIMISNINSFSQQSQNVATNTVKTKRNSIVSLSSRNSTISAAGHSGVSKKLGDFFRRPFSISGFSSSASSNSISSMLSQGLQANGSLPAAGLPAIDVTALQDIRPSCVIRTFEIKSIVPMINHRQIPAFLYSFKIIMNNSTEYMLQATDADDLHRWMKMLKTSKRYSFYSKKFKGKTHNKTFGVPLEDLCEREGTVIPTIVTKLLEEIELRGLDEVGLYRIPGSVGSINALKNAFDEEGAVSNTFTLEDDRWFEINAIAGCFKMYLRELPDSLFSNGRVSEFTKLVQQYNANELTRAAYLSDMGCLLNSLPTCYYETMKRIVIHLNKVHQHVSNNRMDASNLAIVFSMSFIDQEDLSNSMGSTLGAIQSILQDFIKSPGDFFTK